MRRLALAATCLVAITQAAPARADVIFSTLAPSGTYMNGIGWTISGPGGAGLFSQGMQFTSPGNYSVSQIDIALSNVSGTNAATVSLWTDVGNALGVQLGSWAVSNQPALGSTDSILATVSGIVGITLQAGSSYFLMATADGDTWDAWNFNNNGISGGILRLEGPAYITDTLGAFEISGTPAPEPATLALLGTGLLTLAAARRRRAG